MRGYIIKLKQTFINILQSTLVTIFKLKIRLAEEVMYENQIFIAGNKNFLQLINHTPESVKKYNNKDID